MADQVIMEVSDLKVRVMELTEGASTQWHHHTAVDDFFVCLSGTVQIESPDPKQAVVLHPGERTKITSCRIHRVVNLYQGRSEYLLVQGVGPYDFIKDLA